MNNSNHQKVVSNLALNIKRLRLDLGMSQEAFALKAEIDRTFISKIERAAANPSLKTLTTIANILNVPLSQLFYCIENNDD